ncbi:hypothetical protein Pmani_026298 [Petrolisthes manimaculis]|uniref:UDP-glucuronosyltransferase n=1 Tax=Petrolisthes manimaculis TaxID=1843537 RepID=A0AAE1U072_9EUCA|nr:hypothetical protein Pmani_026298 [Petrolisthes manimaculis]
MTIAEELAARNHSITYLTGFESTRERPNIREIYVPGVSLFTMITNTFNTSYFQMFKILLPELHKLCPNLLATQEFQSFHQEGGKFDLVISGLMSLDCFLPYVHTLQVPLVYVFPNMVQGSMDDVAGTPFFHSLGGSMVLSEQFPYSFKCRLIVTFHAEFAKFINVWYSLPKMERECKSRQLCPDGLPSLVELRINSSLFITNSVKTLETPTMPYTPTVVHAGGIHCRPPHPLPQELEEWVSGSGDAGFILFSLGSIVKPSDMPIQYRIVLAKVFGSLNQRVLWKWDEDSVSEVTLPPNVRLEKWLPQQDILGHPQLSLFMTHGGLLSLQEATYHGVPIIGFPLFADQYYNVGRAEGEGWGRLINWEDLSYDLLRNTIIEIINNNKMREEVQRRSVVMRDQPVPPGEWVTYWIEYVIRHRGAVHLRSPAVHMPCPKSLAPTGKKGSNVSECSLTTLAAPSLKGMFVTSGDSEMHKTMDQRCTVAGR